MITVVPGGSAYVVERLGRFHRILPPGTHLLVPVLDRVAFRYSLSPKTADVSDKAITLDNIPVAITSALRWQISDPREVAYGAADPDYYVTTLVKAALREWISRHAWSDARESTRQLEVDVARTVEEALRQVGMKVVELTVSDIDRITS